MLGARCWVLGCILVLPFYHYSFTHAVKLGVAPRQQLVERQRDQLLQVLGEGLSYQGDGSLGMAMRAPGRLRYHRVDHP